MGAVMTHRNLSVDTLKGIGIILMIVAHTYGPNNIIWDLIFSFHMPLFFIVSGLFFKERSVKDTIWKISRQLLIQYIFICISIIILSQIKRPHPITSDLEEVLYGMGPGWFIIAMAQVRLYFTLIYKTFKRFYLIISLTISLLTAILISIFQISMILAFMPALCSLFFYAFGYSIKSYQIKNHVNRYPHISLFAGLLLWLNSSFFGEVELASCTFKLFIIDFMGSIGGTYVFYVVSKKIVNTKLGILLSFTGKYSLAILCIHSIDFCIPLWYRLEPYIPNQYYLTTILIMRLSLVLICCFIISRHHKLRSFFNIK